MSPSLLTNFLMVELHMMQDVCGELAPLPWTHGSCWQLLPTQDPLYLNPHQKRSAVGVSFI